jgi:hypothetical protein
MITLVRATLLALIINGCAFVQAADLPPVIDLTKHQSPHCSQGGRTACTYYPPIAALEAAYRRKGIDVSLSVEHLIWLRNVTAMKSSVKDASINENNLAFLTGGGLSVNFDILNHYGVSRAEHFPYLHDHEDYRAPYYTGFDVTDYKWFEPHRQLSLNRFNLDAKQFPDVARQNAHYGIKQHVFLSGKQCKDVRQLEAILASGREVAINVFVSYPKAAHEKDRGNIPPVVWYVAADAVAKQADSHAMLLVGYDRTRQFFIVKNSWGPTKSGFEADKLPDGWKDITKYKGYTLMHYNYLKGNREAAYINEVAESKESRFPHQRALGLWRFQIEEKDSRKVVADGVLAWRRLMDESKQSFRIGDWHGPDGNSYRVNAERDTTDRSRLTLFINFDNPNQKDKHRLGLQFKCKLSLPPAKAGELQDGTIVATDHVTLLGHPTSTLTFRASQVLDTNLLKGLESKVTKSNKVQEGKGQ